MNSAPTLSKISRPQSGGIVLRPRVLNRIGRGFAASPIVWVVSPAGSGKTKLAISYLEASGLPAIWYEVDAGDMDPASFFRTFGQACAAHLGADSATQPPLFSPDHLFDLAAFARRYFRAVFSGLPEATLLVLENVHAAEAEPSFKGILQAALAEASEHVRILVLSRSAPPPELARLQANQQLALVDWQQLRLTEEETGAILAGHPAALATLEQRPDAERELAGRLHARSGGWVAAVVLLLDQIGRVGSYDVDRLDSREVLFPYFAQEDDRRRVARAAPLPAVHGDPAELRSGRGSPTHRQHGCRSLRYLRALPAVLHRPVRQRGRGVVPVPRAVSRILAVTVTRCIFR
ncbi:MULTISPECIES: hypothetical protein [Ralstonia]|uniref:hypothetical protein n=1 Tax=Ralstonia TaxID=48736 RepID=UPI00201756D3|nr:MULTISPECIES: hypothetical protein [Ralstonia]